MPKNRIFCFDGTCNQPGDAVQNQSRWTGAIEDDNVTNIFKRHLLFGGDLQDGRRFDDQLSLYYPGVALAAGESRNVTVHARLKFSPTGLRVDAGQEYVL